MDSRFMSWIPIEKGWSEDRKYRVTTPNDTVYLLRISPLDRYERQKQWFSLMQQVSALPIPICRPVEFGTCAEGVYTLHTWIEGSDALEVIPHLSNAEQYALGVESGRILRAIHTVPAPADQEDWHTRFDRKTSFKIRQYRDCPVRFSGDDQVIAYIEDHRHLLCGRPQCFQHGDYHIGNMMMENGKLVIIDFDRFDFGDPWEEFNRIVWSAQASPSFAAGQLDGYFEGTPPLAFFERLALYIASNTLSSIYWGASLGTSDLDVMMKQAQDVLEWYDGMRQPIPSWYRQAHGAGEGSLCRTDMD